MSKYSTKIRSPGFQGRPNENFHPFSTFCQSGTLNPTRTCKAVSIHREPIEFSWPRGPVLRRFSANDISIARGFGGVFSRAVLGAGQGPRRSLKGARFGERLPRSRGLRCCGQPAEARFLGFPRFTGANSATGFLLIPTLRPYIPDIAR